MTKPHLLPFSLALLLAACGAEPTKTPKADDQGQQAQQPMDEHGAPTRTEDLMVNGKKVVVMQFEQVEAGKDVPVTCAFASADDRAMTVRAWIGTEDAKGSRKARLAREGDKNLHGHVDIPATLPDGSQLWFSFEWDGGSYVKGITFH